MTLSRDVLQTMIGQGDEDHLRTLAAKCPEGFKPLLRGETLWFVSDDWLERLPPDRRAKLTILEATP